MSSVQDPRLTDLPAPAPGFVGPWALDSGCGLSHDYKGTWVIKPWWDLQSDTWKCNTSVANTSGKQLVEMDTKPEVLSQQGRWIHLSCSHFPRPTGKFSLGESKHLGRQCPAGSCQLWSCLVPELQCGCGWLVLYVEHRLRRQTNLTLSLTYYPSKAPSCLLFKFPHLSVTKLNLLSVTKQVAESSYVLSGN